ncbi:ABC transporter permease [Geminicoccaceae bacterium 1502E]|nr:ABC transporter permease [Geminicoccaceae bacterium 1502E]
MSTALSAARESTLARLRRGMNTGALNGVLSFLAVFALWELVCRGLAVPAYLLPAPSEVLVDFLRQWQRMLSHALFTTQVIAAGFALAVVVSVPLSLMIAYSRLFETTVYPMLVVFQIIPKIAVAPLFIVWFGFGLPPKVMLVFLLSFFPIVIAGIAGFRAADPDILDLARTTGAGQWKMFKKIRLPQALPQLFTGLKVGAAMAATAAVVAEFIGSDRGLGYLILEYNGNIETGMTFAAIILLSVIGVAVYYAVELAERIAIPWHVSHRGDAGR